MRHELVTATAVVVGVVNIAHSETIRCGSWLVDGSVTIDLNSNTRKIGTTVTEYWTYDRGTQAAPVLVTIVDGRIRSIERIK